MRSILSTLLLLLTIIPICSANEGNWELRHSTESIQVHQQSTPSGYPVTRTIATVNTSLDALLLILRDRSTCQRWLHACKEGRLTTQYSPEKRLDYTVIDSPFLFADRDMYIASTTSYNPQSKTVLVRLTGQENQDAGQVNKVRVKNLQGFWRFQQIADNKVEITYQIFSNPQLPASSFLNTYMADSGLHTVRNLARLSQEKPYRDAKLPELHKPVN